MDCLHQTEPSSMQAWRTSCKKPCLENWLHFALFKVQLVNENFCTGQLVNEKQTILKRTFVFSLILISLIFSFVSFFQCLFSNAYYHNHDYDNDPKMNISWPHPSPERALCSCFTNVLRYFFYSKIINSVFIPKISDGYKIGKSQIWKDVKVDARENSLSPRTSTSVSPIYQKPIWKHF